MQGSEYKNPHLMVHLKSLIIYNMNRITIANV